MACVCHIPNAKFKNNKIDMFSVLLLVGYIWVWNAGRKTENDNHDRKSGQLSSDYKITKTVM